MGIYYFSFYFRSRQAYENFGKLGRIIGPESAHSFYALGNKVVAILNRVGWFSPEGDRDRDL